MVLLSPRPAPPVRLSWAGGVHPAQSVSAFRAQELGWRRFLRHGACGLGFAKPSPSPFDRLRLRSSTGRPSPHPDLSKDEGVARSLGGAPLQDRLAGGLGLVQPS